MEFPLIDRRSDALGDLRVLPDEVLCSILEILTPTDIARLSCVSSVMYILCNEEPLWMHLCLSSVGGLLEYKGSWKETTIHHHHLSKEFAELRRKPLHFNGFNSLFLYRRWYRCFTSLDTFSVGRGDLERIVDLSLEEFHSKYDGKKPVLLTELAKNWPVKSTWTIEWLLQNVGDTAFRISQRGTHKITMKFKDYVKYMGFQHDEDPLYIFDDKFGDVAPSLLKNYSVPYLFQEDLFDVLDRDQRPPFRWLIIGPQRSGASWHVDPALTSAWNTLLYGRKRWALYPPGKVPLGVTVHVSEEDGDVNIDTPSSLQWWLDIYPLLAEHDKPLECTQLPGETIFVPSGWWHCVLNLETSIAVTQNFVNTSNFEFVCLDMAPGYRHKGACRAGLLAIRENVLESLKDESYDIDQSNFQVMPRERKRLKFSRPGKHPFVDDSEKKAINGVSCSPGFSQNHEFSYTIDYLSMLLEEDRDHYTSIWSPSNCIGQREIREWLQKLWVKKPGIRELVWKGACIALNADKWSERMMEICASHNFPSPTNDERLPVGTGSNPVYLMGDHVIKIYVEGGLESSINSLGTELEFYSLLDKVKSPLRGHIPDILASGILFYENGSYRTVAWDGKGVPDAIRKCNIICESCPEDGFSFGVWNKKQFEVRKAGLLPVNGRTDSGACTRIWPYIIMRKCEGDIFTHLREILPRDDVLELASFLGNQVRSLHLLPLPSFRNPSNANALPPEVKREPFTKMFNDIETCSEVPSANALEEPAGGECSSIPVEWSHFIETMNRRKNDIISHLTKWGDPIPSILIEKVEEYIPHDTSVLLNISKDKDGMVKVSKSLTWIHSDIMDDNVQMEPGFPTQCLEENAANVSLTDSAVDGYVGDMEQRKWHAKYILDFSDISIGDPLCDLIPIYLDIFRGDSELLDHFLDSYRLPLTLRPAHSKMCLNGSEESRKYGRLSYCAMCYCILHEENVLGAIFSLWKELRMAKSWEEVEETVWGRLNYYQVPVEDPHSCLYIRLD